MCNRVLVLIYSFYFAVCGSIREAAAQVEPFFAQIVVYKGGYFRGNALLFSSFGGRDFLNNQVNNKCYRSRCANPMVQEQIVLGDVDEGERVVIVVAATRVVTSSQNFSLVANGESPDPFAPHPLIAHCG